MKTRNSIAAILLALTVTFSQASLFAFAGMPTVVFAEDEHETQDVEQNSETQQEVSESNGDDGEEVSKSAEEGEDNAEETNDDDTESTNTEENEGSVDIEDNNEEESLNDNDDEENSDAQSQTETLSFEASVVEKEQCVLPQGNLIVNGGFESPVVTHEAKWNIFPSGTEGWSASWVGNQTTHDEFTRPETAQIEIQKTGIFTGAVAWDGSQFAELDTDWTGPSLYSFAEPALISLYQDVETEIGYTYKLSYYYAYRPDVFEVDDNSMTVKVAGNVEATHEADSEVDNMSWVKNTIYFTATDTTTRIEFIGGGTNNSLGILLDNVDLFATSCDDDGDDNGDDNGNDDDGDDDNGGEEPKKKTIINVHARKVVCTNPDEMPRWGSYGSDITETTAIEYAEAHDSCELASGWEFQWGFGDSIVNGAGVTDPGESFYGKAPVGTAHDEWKNFNSPTNGDGLAKVEIIYNSGEENKIWVREALKEGYVDFAGVVTETDEESAEMYCHKDVLNYDNYDFIEGLEHETLYHCVAFNLVDGDDSGGDDNMCLDTVTPRGDGSPLEIGESFGENDKTLVEILEDNGYVVEEESDQKRYETWLTSNKDVTFEVELLGRESAYKHTFGYYEEGNIKNTYTPLFRTGSDVAQKATTTPILSVGGTEVFTIPAHTEIGFGIKVFTNGMLAGRYATENDHNADNEADHVVVYEIEDGYALGFEDLPSTALTDEDYNDVVVAIRAIQCTDPTNGGGGDDDTGIDLDVEKTASVSTTTPEATFSYTISVTNNGPEDATGVEVTDMLPSEVTFVSATSTVGSYATSTSIWTIGTLTASTTETLTIDVMVASSTTSGDFVNTATATSTDAQTDNNTDNNSDSVTVSIDDGNNNGGGGNSDEGIDLNVSKTASISEVSETGVEFDYIVTVTNNGPEDATGVEVTDILPAEVLFKSATSTVGSYATSTSIWTIGTLADDATATLTVTVEVIDISDDIVNVAIAESTDGQTDTNPDNNSGSHTVTIDTGDNNGGGGSSSGGGSGGSGGGSGGGTINNVGVGGANVDAPQCEYLKEFLRYGENNNPVEVTKLEAFLNAFEGESLDVDGFFDLDTDAAVRRFQVKYFGDILDPWGHTDSTGYVYILTKKKVNEIYCDRAFPVTNAEANEIVAFRAFLESLRAQGIDTTEFEGGIGGDIGDSNLADDTATSGIADFFRNLFGGNDDETATSTDGVLAGGNNEGSDQSRFVETISNLAAAALIFPGDLGDALGCLIVLLIILAIIYALGTIIVNGMSDDTTAIETVRGRKIVAFMVGTLIAIIIALIVPYPCIILPLVIIFIALAIWWTVRRGEDKPEEMSKEFTLTPDGK